MGQPRLAPGTQEAFLRVGEADYFRRFPTLDRRPGKYPDASRKNTARLTVSWADERIRAATGFGGRFERRSLGSAPPARARI